MRRETLIWTVLFIAGGLFLLHRATLTNHGMGKVYVIAQPINEKSPDDGLVHFVETRPNPGNEKVVLSYPRTVGLWLAAFFTLAIFSFLYRDNVFYKVAESIMVGVSAGWAMASAGFWDTLVPKLLAKLAPQQMTWALPKLESQPPGHALVYLVPLALGIMLLWRLAPRGGWIARWPLAFIVGTFAGIKLTNYLDADFVNQIRSTIIPLLVFAQSGQIDLWASVRNIGLIFGVLSCLTYFFFSFEHHGIAGKVARIGIWYLMITFGASFAFTVMGRIALLASRISFLFDDWLWLIDPSGKRPPGW